MATVRKDQKMMNDEMDKTDWVMILSLVRTIIEKSENKEKALEELDELIQEAKSLGKKA